MHSEAAITFKPLIIAIGGGVLASAEPLIASTDIAEAFRAIGVYGLPTVLVVYFVVRDWVREREHAKQLIADKEELAKLTEADKTRSHEVRRERDREQSQMIAAERARNHELQMSLLDLLHRGVIDAERIAKISDSTTGKFVTKNQGNNS